MCEEVGPWTFNNEMTFTCNDPNARIVRIWADMGLQPEGECGQYKPNGNCSNNLLATAWAAERCFGRRSCTLQKESVWTDMTVCPKKVFGTNTINFFSERLTVQASCSGNGGGVTSAEYSGDSVFAQGFVSADRNSKKVLVVNKLAKEVSVSVHIPGLGRNGATAYIVDSLSVSRSAEQGIRQEHWKSEIASDTMVVKLQPFAVVLAVVGETTVASPAGAVLI
jgi:hypothetical protein